jgi:hypothetical protein
MPEKFVNQLGLLEKQLEDTISQSDSTKASIFSKQAL